MTDDEFKAAICAALAKHSCSALADELMVSKSTIGRWSRGRNLPREGVRGAVAERLPEPPK